MPGRSSFSTVRRAPARRPSLVPCKRLSDEPWVRPASTLSGTRSMSGGWNTARAPQRASRDCECADRPAQSATARGGHASRPGHARARAGNDMLVDDVFVDPARLDGWRSELRRPRVAPRRSAGTTRRLRNARPPEATGLPASALSVRCDSQRDRVRRHCGDGTSVAGGVRPRDPGGARAPIRVHGRRIRRHAAW